MVIAKNIIIVSFCVLLITPFVFSEEQTQTLKPNLSSVNTDNLSKPQKQARAYREEGFKQQSLGNLDAAVSFYQKAIYLDPSYAVAYNDLGVIYETEGSIDRAEENYLKALSIDPNFLSAYSNLALLYENKRDLDKAFLSWKKRAELGSPSDPWTQKAKKRMDDIIQVIPSLKQAFIEKKTIALMKEAAEKQRIKKQEELKEPKKHLQAATKLYNKREYNQALDMLNSFLSLNPENKDAQALVDKIKNKMKEQEELARQKKERERPLAEQRAKREQELKAQQEKEANIKKLQEYFKNGVRYYQQDNLQAAQQEFEKTVGLTAAPRKE